MVTELPSFEAQFADLDDTFGKLKSVLSEKISVAKRQALAARGKADHYILLAAASIMLAMIFLTWTITAPCAGPFEIYLLSRTRLLRASSTYATNSRRLANLVRSAHRAELRRVLSHNRAQ
jgi:hypothetical protein